MSVATAILSRLAFFARLLRLPVPPVPPPAGLGVVGGRLAPCGARSNCVSSYGDDERNAIPPLPGPGGRERTMARLERVLAAERGAAVVERRGGYLRAEFTTPLWRFVDDVEFLWDEGAGVLHFRSASRIGRSDLGANRRRMERIRAALAAAS